MGRKKVYTITQVTHDPKLFRGAKPFDITHIGRVVATVVEPGGLWRACEHCKENTRNVQEFQNKNGTWLKLILCDKCSDELL